MTDKQPWDDIFDFKHYRVIEVRKIITRWKRVNEISKKERRR